MANPTTGQFQTLCAAFNDAAKSLKFKNEFVDAIYWDYQPVVATPYVSLQVIIPTVNEGAVVDIQSGPIQPLSYSYTPVSIVLNMHYSNSIVIKSWDQVRTPNDLKRIFVQPKMEELLRKINRTIVSQFTAANFPNYTLFTGTSPTASDFTRADIATAWANLVNAGVPIDTEPDKVKMLVNPTSYGAMISDNNFLQQFIVGDKEAVDVQQKAQLRLIYGADLTYDQMLAPFNAGHQPAILMHEYAVAAVTANPPPGGPNVEESYVMLKGKIPVQFQMAYSMIDQGWVIHMHCMWGVKVVRPEMVSLFQSLT